MNDELELGHYGRIFRRSWWIIAIAVIATTLLSALLLPGQDNFYTSSISVLLRPGDADVGPASDPIIEDTEIGIALSALIGERVIAQQPTIDLDTWRENLTISACLDTGAAVTSTRCDSQILEMSYRGETPEQSRAIVEQTADSYLDFRIERETLLKESRLTDISNQYDDLDLQAIQEIRQLGEAPEGSVEATISELRLRGIENRKLELDRQLTSLNTPIDVGDLLGQEASTPEADSSGLPRSFSILAGVLMGLLLGGLLAILTDRLDRRVSSAEETEVDLGVPVLGDIPRITEGSPALVTAMGSQTLGAEAFRRLAAAALAPRSGFVVDSIAVTGANDGEGRTTASVNLALAIAQTGRRVLLVGADRRNEAIDQLFGLSLEPGLNDFLRSKADLEAARNALDSAPERLNITILPTGVGAPTPLSNNGISALLAIAEERSMIVVFDTPPALTHADGLQIAAVVDAVFIVAAIGRTRRSELSELRVQLLNVQADIAGAILNRNSRMNLLAGFGDVGTVNVPSGVPGNAASRSAAAHSFGEKAASTVAQASPIEQANVISDDEVGADVLIDPSQEIV